MSVQTVNATLDAGRSVLPAESPLGMPEQTFRDGRLQVPRQRTAPRMIALRRFYIFGGTAAMTAAATHMMWKV
ncbi:MAG: glucans biosynthesis glucosyltransferase MdoH, partial [Stenotrophomonas sp.]